MGVVKTAGGEALIVPISLDFGIDDSSLQLGSFGYSTNWDTDVVLIWLLESLQHAWPDIARGACGLLHSSELWVAGMQEKGQKNILCIYTVWGSWHHCQFPTPALLLAGPPGPANGCAA